MVRLTLESVHRRADFVFFQPTKTRRFRSPDGASSHRTYRRELRFRIRILASCGIVVFSQRPARFGLAFRPER
jgi:hypothetical protein